MFTNYLDKHKKGCNQKTNLEREERNCFINEILVAVLVNVEDCVVGN